MGVAEYFCLLPEYLLPPLSNVYCCILSCHVNLRTPPPPCLPPETQTLLAEEARRRSATQAAGSQARDAMLQHQHSHGGRRGQDAASAARAVGAKAAPGAPGFTGGTSSGEAGFSYASVHSSLLAHSVEERQRIVSLSLGGVGRKLPAGLEALDALFSGQRLQGVKQKQQEETEQEQGQDQQGHHHKHQHQAQHGGYRDSDFGDGENGYGGAAAAAKSSGAARRARLLSLANGTDRATTAAAALTMGAVGDNRVGASDGSSFFNPDDDNDDDVNDDDYGGGAGGGGYGGNVGVNGGVGGQTTTAKLPRRPLGRGALGAAPPAPTVVVQRRRDPLPLPAAQLPWLKLVHAASLPTSGENGLDTKVSLWVVTVG